ncbi:hypothetical protein Atoyac15_06 [Aeromonas phage Atoyac15]|uniref:Uncharacterized protein n=1 Tax=Aeromonas phage Atoyac15 TaxID=2767551 RepID=A0A866D1M6_9CAUD|nr:hypothetical protein Atoyac15_06 [Aeromonas phage Atoyac15]
MWAQLIMAGVNMIEGHGKAKSNRMLAEAQYTLDSGRADRAHAVRGASNELGAATASLQRVEQSLNNQRLGRITEQKQDENSRNYVQSIDGITSQKFENRLVSANNLGSVAASAAAAGVAGGSVEQVAQVEGLRAARVNKALEDQQDNANWAKLYNDTAIQDNLISQTDTSGIFADIDYTSKDLVFNNAWQHKYSLMDSAMDGMNGFMGNMDKVGKNGINAKSFGYSPDVSMFGKGGTGKNNTGPQRSLIKL